MILRGVGCWIYVLQKISFHVILNYLRITFLWKTRNSRWGEGHFSSRLQIKKRRRQGTRNRETTVHNNSTLSLPHLFRLVFHRKLKSIISCVGHWMNFRRYINTINIFVTFEKNWHINIVNHYLYNKLFLYAFFSSCAHVSVCSTFLRPHNSNIIISNHDRIFNLINLYFFVFLNSSLDIFLWICYPIIIACKCFEYDHNRPKIILIYSFSWSEGESFSL